MTSKARSVKKLGGSILSALVLCTTAIAPSAFAADSPLVEQTVKVKFKLSELKEDNGTQTVYNKIKKRASSYCRKSSVTLIYLGQSKQDCTADLLNQFIENANVEPLIAYHLAQTSDVAAKKFALNKN